MPLELDYNNVSRESGGGCSQEIEEMAKLVLPVRGPLAAVWLLFLIPTLLILGCSHKSARQYIRAGDQALHDNQVGSAQEDYEAAVKLAPDSARTHLKLGDFYMFEHNYPAAETQYIKVATLQPFNAQSRARLASVYSARAQWSLAENQMRAAVALDPISSDYRVKLANVLNRRNQVGQAEIELRTAVGLSPADARMHLALANFLATLPNQRNAADEEFARVRQLDPSLLPSAESSAEPGTMTSGAAPGPSMNPGTMAPPGGEVASAPPPSAPAMAPAAKPMKVLNKRFRLTHNSPVYQNPDGSSAVLAQVHRRRYVHVTGITGDWLQVTLHNGTVGFIPVSAAE
jgi:tetratricopeptide (TPR) repeat protein